jgi:hypothetical protein
MAIYTIYVTPGSYSSLAAAERARLISDRFAVPAMLLGPIWLACNRLWWPLVAYAVAGVAIAGAAYGLHLSAATTGLLFVLMGCFLGLEGRPLLEAALQRRGFQVVDLVSAANREEAERIFFSRWLTPQPSPAGTPPRPPLPLADPDAIIGLFPSAGGKW